LQRQTYGVLSALDACHLASRRWQSRGKETSMRNYEVAYLVDSELDEDSRTELEDKVKSWIVAAGGTVVSVDNWEKRRLAYPINKKNEGYYVFIQTEMPNTAGRAVERDLTINELILRFMITLQEDS
jgi:small subunit ribosomal protein S6